MSLSTPKELWKEFQKSSAEVFFFFVMLLLIVPLVQWGFICVGVLAACLGHWFIGGILMAVGLLSRYIGKNLEF